MSVAVVTIDFRSLAVTISLITMWLISSFIDHLYRTNLTYLGYVLFSIAILALLFLDSNRKISIINERFLMQASFFGKKELSKYDILKVDYIKNSMYKHRIIQYIPIFISTITIFVIEIHKVYETLTGNWFKNEMNIFVPVFLILAFTFMSYRLYSCSRYQKIIKIDSNSGKITLYPENKEKYLRLKKKLNLLTCDDFKSQTRI